MSGFSAQWLALRENADRAARSEAVLQKASAYLSSDGTALEVCDLGSGTGASVRAFSGLFPKPQTWQLVDYDAANLQRAKERYAGGDAITGVSIETKVHDLSADGAPWRQSTRLVTATALFDLTSPGWLAEFASALVRDRLPLLATLTYDGRHVFTPELPFDAEMGEAFNVHQRSDKGFGPAAGPDAVACLERHLRDHGYEVTLADSSWCLEGERDADMITALLEGWVDAVVERNLVPESDARAWHVARSKNTQTLHVGHQDLFASPAT